MGLLDAVIGALANSQGGGRGPMSGGGGLGDLGSLLGGGGGGGGGQAALLNIVLSMLANSGGGARGMGAGGAGGGGGLGDLMAQFQGAGLGEVMNSWISTGQNQPISHEQIGQVLGKDRLSQIAEQLGVSQVDAASQLSELMPQVVDRLTPQGQAPSGGFGSVEDLLGMLMKR